MEPIKFLLGSELCAEDQAEVLRAYVHRYTGDHKPRWAQPKEDVPGIVKWGASEKPYPLQFASDAEWLANTRFAVRKNGRLDRRAKHCYSRPTWPRAQSGT